MLRDKITAQKNCVCQSWSSLLQHGHGWLHVWMSKLDAVNKSLVVAPVFVFVVICLYIFLFDELQNIFVVENFN